MPEVILISKSTTGGSVIAPADLGTGTPDTTTYLRGDGSWQVPPGGGGNAFGTIAVSGQSDVVADTGADTLTLVAGTNITITTNATTDSVTIAASGGSGSNTLYAPGSVTVATGNFAMHVKRLQLTSTQRLTLAGTARLRISN